MRLRNSPAGRPMNQITRDTVTPSNSQYCSILIFQLQKFLCWKFGNLLLRNKVLFCLLTYCIPDTQHTLYHLLDNIRGSTILRWVPVLDVSLQCVQPNFSHARYRSLARFSANKCFYSSVHFGHRATVGKYCRFLSTSICLRITSNLVVTWDPEYGGIACALVEHVP